MIQQCKSFLFFRAKKGDQVDESKIQKMFITGENKQLLEMIGAIPPEYFELVEEIFEKAKKEYGFLPKEKETLASGISIPNLLFIHFFAYNPISHSFG